MATCCAVLCYAGADGLFMVVDERGVFKDDSFQAAVAALQDSNAAAATAQSGKGRNKGDKKQPKQVCGPRELVYGTVSVISAVLLACSAVYEPQCDHPQGHALRPYLTCVAQTRTHWLVALHVAINLAGIHVMPI